MAAGSSALRIVGLTGLAMVAFAANSVLGRLGLVDGGIGPGSFAAIRLVSGAILLCFIAGVRASASEGTWSGAISLLVYAAFFSYAYLELGAGMGALILFAVVQITMVGAGLVSGERLSFLQWTGLLSAMAGLIWLLSPGLTAPPFEGAVAMAIAGIGWGAYSLLGRAVSADPTARTAGNFARASLVGLVLLPGALMIMGEPTPATYGITLAIISGAITSGLGYAIWYAALPGLSAATAGIAQLTVPAIAALGGIVFLNEALTARFGLSTVIILGGVALATLTRRPG
ncbi:MAG: DMT family transporter [Pseudomonadota bacterium]